MKKLITLILLLSALFTLAACGGKNNDPASGDKPNDSKENGGVTDYVPDPNEDEFNDTKGSGDVTDYVPDPNEDEFNDVHYAAAYPQDFEYNGSHYRRVQGDASKTSVTSDGVGELLGYVIRGDDVTAFSAEYPGTNYVIDDGIYDYYAHNRVPFYSITAYQDLSIICMKQGGEYVTFCKTNG